MFGITVAALLTAALILPGVVGLSIFYANVGTAEVKLSPPPLGTVAAFAMAGVISVLAHLVWAGVLSVNAAVPIFVALPPPDPYRLLFAAPGGAPSVIQLFMALTGLSATLLLGGVIGWLMTRGRFAWRGQLLFGWLYPILERAGPADIYINAHVLTRIEAGDQRLGYEGSVDNIVLDETRQIIGLTLRDATPFRMRLYQGQWQRMSAGADPLPRIVLKGDDMHNVVLVPVRDVQGGQAVAGRTVAGRTVAGRTPQ